MGKWSISANGEVEPAFVAASVDGHVSLHIPSSDPILVTVEKAENIRQVIGAAITDAQAAPRDPR